MRVLTLPEIRRTLVYSEIIGCMREALMAQARGECETPMPMHLDIAPEAAEVHIKSSYRSGGHHFALKIAGTFPGNARHGVSTSSGMMLLSCAETGEPVAFLADDGHLTDVRTAAVAAMVAREFGRQDSALGILGSGVQARLQAAMHAEVLPLETIWIWGRTPERAEACAHDIREVLPGRTVLVAESAAQVAEHTRLIVTTTASQAPLLTAEDIQPGTHISAVGADSPGKQELDPAILRQAGLILADSLRQCARLGELQHSADEIFRAREFTEDIPRPAADDITVADFTGLGVEDLYIAEYVYRKAQNQIRSAGF